ncbi:MAG: RNA polymerase sigma factor [Desulfocucumaceae bacterium]
MFINESLDKIYKVNYGKIYAFIFNISANRSLAEDITQETFIKAYRNIDSLREEAKISVWLNKIAYNLFLDYKRNRNSKLLSIDDDLLMSKLTDFKKSITRETEQKIMSECIQSKILLIPENHRIPLLLDIQGYSNSEKAAILECSLENAKIRLHRARKKMKQILGKDCTFYYDERNVLC